MNPDLFVWVISSIFFFIIVMGCIALTCDIKKGVICFLGLLFAFTIFIGICVTLPMFFLNRAILSKMLSDVEPDYRVALEEEKKTRPRTHWTFLEPPMPVFWPFPVFSRDMETSRHKADEQKCEAAFRAAALKHPGNVVLSFLITLFVGIFFMALMGAGESGGKK